jgi:hypothetical protein
VKIGKMMLGAQVRRPFIRVPLLISPARVYRCERKIQVGASIALYPDLGGWSHVICARQVFTEADVKATTAKVDSPLMAALRERQLSRLAGVKSD